jgi:hypothetical protein
VATQRRRNFFLHYLGLIGRMPAIIQSSVRWYSAIFLLAFILLSAIGLPLFIAFGSLAKL